MSDPTPCIDEIAELLVHIGRTARGEETGTTLTAAQWTGLRFFARANAASRTPSAFASFQATTRGTASQMVKSLESRGLLTRRRNDADGRSVRFEITEAGRAMLAHDPLRHLVTALERLDPEARESFLRTLARLSGDLATLRGSRAFGTCGDCDHYAAGATGTGGYCACAAAALPVGELGRLCANFQCWSTEDGTPAGQSERSDET
jgi:DNA-binding MarR family transcriptional regulator